MSSLFQGTKHAAAYAKFRPVFQTAVWNEIVGFCKSVGNEFRLALDVGCGSGQSTIPLSPHFQKVLGVDPSASQISQAPTTCDNVEFRVGSAEDLSFQGDGAVDLVTCFQSLHWIDTTQFYSEVDRVLAPGGVLFACGYGNVKLDNGKASDRVAKYYHDTLHKGGYWDDRRGHIDNHYADFKFPMDDFKRIDHHVMEKTFTLEAFIGYMQSWSSYRSYLKKNPDHDPLVDIMKDLCQAYQCDDPATQAVVATWPVFMLLGSKPK